MTERNPLLKGDPYTVSPCMDKYPPIQIPDPFRRMPDELKDAGIETKPDADGMEDDHSGPGADPLADRVDSVVLRQGSDETEVKPTTDA